VKSVVAPSNLTTARAKSMRRITTKDDDDIFERDLTTLNIEIDQNFMKTFDSRKTTKISGF
jgi:hypothetical protein